MGMGATPLIFRMRLAEEHPRHELTVIQKMKTVHAKTARIPWVIGSWQK